MKPTDLLAVVFAAAILVASMVAAWDHVIARHARADGFGAFRALLFIIGVLAGCAWACWHVLRRK